MVISRKFADELRLCMICELGLVEPWKRVSGPFSVYENADMKVAIVLQFDPNSAMCKEVLGGDDDCYLPWSSLMATRGRKFVGPHEFCQD
jgi:hypothetical protein